MSQRVTVSIPDDHYAWLEEVRKRRGWDTIPAAIRSVIEDSFRLDRKLGPKKIDEPVSLIQSEVDLENEHVQTS